MTPFGNVPLALKVGAGNPLAATVKLPKLPSVKVTLFALVIDGRFVHRQGEVLGRAHRAFARAEAVVGREDEIVDAAGAGIRRAR